MIRRGLLMLIVAGLAGCGGGGGGSTAGGSDVIGVRGMPDGEVTVRAVGSTGGSRVLRIDLPAEYPTVSTIEVGVAIGSGEPPLLVPATSESPGRWRVEVALPTPLPTGARAFVRVRHADGAVVESGSEDFPLR